VELHELSREEFDLERLFFTLTEGAYQGASFENVPPMRPPQQGPSYPGGAR